MAELKPCPFCGGGAFVDVYMDTEFVNVYHHPQCLPRPTTWDAAWYGEVPLKIQVKNWNWRTEDGNL